MNLCEAFASLAILPACLFAQVGSHSQNPDSKMYLGQLSDGTEVWAERSPTVGWELKTRGSTIAASAYTRPVQLEFDDAVLGRRMEAQGYDSVRKTESGFHGEAAVRQPSGVSLRVEDEWTLSGSVMALSRAVTVSGNDKGGFMSAITVFTEKPWSRPDVDIFAPGLIYGGTEHLRDTGPGGARVYREGHGIVLIREERFPAPLFAVRFRDGSSIALLDPAPRGGTTKADAFDVARGDVIEPLVDARFQFGALGEDESGSWRGDRNEPEGLSLRTDVVRDPALGFWFPGTEGELRYGFGPCRIMRRRFHPLQDGFSHRYEVAFRFGRDEDFTTLMEKSWRWAWDALKPPVLDLDVELVRRTLLDLLANVTVVSDGRAVMPFLTDSTRGEVVAEHRNGRMGFISRNVEGADLFLMEAARSQGERSEKFHRLGVLILDSFAQLKYAPPEGVGLWVDSGRPVEGLVFLRLITEDLFYMLTAWERERAQGREHPLWLERCREFGDWLLAKQDPDGGWPRAWKRNSNEVVMPSTLNTYNGIAFLVKLSEVTGEKKYLEAAIRAGNLSWKQGQSRGVFVGGTPDNPNVIDKEAAVLSLNGYLLLYETTKDQKWLRRARLAGTVGETWIYLWNIPMPSDIDDTYLSWKHGVPTVGVQLIATGHSGADQWMSRDVANYAKLYKHTGDEHFLEVTRVLLRDTKSMIALPGQTYDLAGPGFQDEAWRFVAPAPRLPGSRRVWLPWMTINHLRGIFDLEELDAALFSELSAD